MSSKKRNNNSNGIRFSGGDGEGNTDSNRLRLRIDLNSKFGDLLLDTILDLHLTPSEKEGAPIGFKLQTLALQNVMGLLSTEVKASSNIKVEQYQQQQHKSAASTVQGTKTTAPISSGFEHTPAKRRRFSPIPEAEPYLSNELDIERLNISLNGSSQADSSHNPGVKAEIPKLSPGKLRSIKLKARMKRCAKVRRSFKRLHSLRPHLLRCRKIKTRSRHDRMHRACTNYMLFLAGKYGVLKERSDKLKIKRKKLSAQIADIHYNLPNKGPVINLEDMRRLYDRHVRSRAQNNFKFWILGFIIEPLLTTYTCSVPSNDFQEICQTSLQWMSDDYAFMDLTSALTDKIAYLSVTTDLLADTPTTFPYEVARALNNARGEHPHLYGRM